MVEKKKINWLLILQGWAMLWVVIGHSYVGVYLEGPKWESLLCNFAYSFHMPLFMFVSGWLFYLTRLSSEGGVEQKWTYRAILKDKSLRILLPGLVFSMVAFAVKIIFPGEVARQISFSWHEIIHAFLYPYDNPFRELWFIVTLFWFFILTPLWKIALKREWSTWLMLLVLIVAHFLEPDTIFLSIDRVFRLSVWFYLGIIVSKKDWVDKFFIRMPFAIFLFGAGFYVMGMFTDSFVLTLGGIIFSLSFAMIADKYIPRLFFSFRNYTYQVFLIGIFAQMLVKIMYKHIFMPYFMAYILCILMGLYVPVLVSKLIKRIDWKPILLCVGLKPSKK